MGLAIETIENEIRKLPQEQLRQFRAWYEKFDSDAWDEQIEEDTSGKLNVLAEAAIADHKAGKTRKL